MKLKNRDGYAVPRPGELDLSDHLEVGEFVIWMYAQSDTTEPRAYAILSDTVLEIVDVDGFSFDEIRDVLDRTVLDQFKLSPFDMTMALINAPKYPLVVWEPHDERLITKWER